MTMIAPPPLPPDLHAKDGMLGMACLPVRYVDVCSCRHLVCVGVC